MTDRELLEAAAKAAGLYEIFPAPDYEVQWNGDGLWLCGNGNGVLWNPLTDDGDALRLAVKLRLHIDHQHANSGLAVWMWPEDMKKIASFEERNDKDPPAATRRAIVRAAAEIGKHV
jgi:hypothetical protein